MKKNSKVDKSGLTIDNEIATGTWLPLYSIVSKSIVESLRRCV